MRFIGDLHIHSRYSRATSGQMVPEGIWRWAQLKGISVVGTGDFTHPKWFAELSEKLKPLDNGLYGLKEQFGTAAVPESCRGDVSFILSAEISCIYKKGDRTRKVHSVVLLPDLAAAFRFNRALSRLGNITSDGRPILGLDAKDLLAVALDASDRAVFIPAHAWTPHFSVFGAASGFDSLDECFEDLTGHIRAIETGLSSDPPMNWRLSALDGLTLLSNSDAHSPAKMGREANRFDTDLSFEGIKKAIETGDGFLGTIEFFPEEGKYHYDGHRACGVNVDPAQTARYNFRCPICGKRLTIGVMHRVEVLADRKPGFRPAGAKEYRSMIPLQEILAEARGAGPSSKGVQDEYMRLVSNLGSEFHILLESCLADIEAASSPIVAEGLRRVRAGEVRIVPGYDGEYGRITIFDGRERQVVKGQGTLL